MGDTCATCRWWQPATPEGERGDCRLHPPSVSETWPQTGKADFCGQHTRERVVFCSFCGKSQHEVAKIIAGPDRVYICNECVALCVEVIAGKHVGPERKP